MLLVVPMLLALATCVSLFLLLSKGRRLPGCGPTSACDAVTTSRWSRLGSLPISLPGTLLYFLMLVAVVMDSFSPASLPFSGFILPLLATVAISSALWFISLQLLVIRRLCLYCTLTHAAAGVAAILLLTYMPPLSLTPIAIGIACTLLFITLQILIHPKQYEMTPAADLPFQPDLVPLPTVSAITLSLLDGKVQISRTDWPLLGSATAAQTIALLFDPTCHDCRDVYRTLLQATRQASDQLAVLAVPVPMHQVCNPVVLPSKADNPEACDYARLTLALWRIDQAIYHQFQTWLLGRSNVPPLMEARGQASRLLGSTRLTMGLMDPATETRLRGAVGIYCSLKPDQLPQLLLPHGIVQGKITIADLAKLLESPQAVGAAPSQGPPAMA